MNERSQLLCATELKATAFVHFFSRGNAPTPFFFDRQRKTTMAIEQKVDRTRQASILGEFRLSNIHLFFALTTNLKSTVVFSATVKGQKISKAIYGILNRDATAGKAGKVCSLPRFWVSIHSYKKQLVKNFWGKPSKST